MAKLTDVPPEIIREIAQCVGNSESDLPTSKSASLACKQLKDAFQEHVFAQVHLHDKDKYKIERFLSIAMDSIHLLQYISSFSIMICTLLDEELLLHVLSHGSNIRKLSIGENYRDMESEELGTRDALCSEISTILTAHPLEEIHLHHLYHIPMTFLSKLPNLKCFSLDKNESETFPFRSSEEAPIQLDTLQVRDNIYESVAEWLLHPMCLFDVAKVKTLRLESTLYLSVLVIWEIMKKCVQVETMHIDFLPLEDDWNEMDFSIFPNLRTRQIHFSLSDEGIADTINQAFNSVKLNGTSIHKILIDVIANEVTDELLEGLHHWIYRIYAIARAFKGSQKVEITFFQVRPQDEEEISALFTDANLHRFKHFEVKFCEGESSGPYVEFGEDREVQ